MRILTALLVTLAVTVWPTAAAATAAEPITWSVEPTADAAGPRDDFDYDTPAGMLISDSVEISNRGDSAATFAVYATDAINELETGAFSLKARDEPAIDAGSWITLSSAEVSLAPGERAIVPFQLSIPTDATPGDHVAGIVAAVTSTTESGQSVTLEQRVGERVYITIDGPLSVTTEIQGIVGGFSPAINPFEPGTLEVVYTVANAGNTRIDALHAVAVTGPFGVPLAETTGEPILDLLPGQEVRVRVALPAIAAVGLVFADATVTPVPVGTGEASAADAADPEAVSDPAASTGDSGAQPAPAEEAALATLAEGDAVPEVEYAAVTANAIAPAVSWTMLALILVVLIGGVIVVRAVTGARHSLYEEIDRLEASRAEPGAERA